MLDMKDIEKQAREEIAHEDHQQAVAAAKLRIREEMGRPWWRKLFPYRIKLEKL